MSQSDANSSLGMSDNSSRERIAREEARLASLEREAAEVRSQLLALRAGSSTPAMREAQANNSVLSPLKTSQSWTIPQKVAIFRSLFRGREDVFPKLWINRRGPIEKKGYAPACKNEWIRGICEKPRVKCGECPNQAFFCVTDQVVQHHLQGHHVIGIYPLLLDETCWFLAADFDKKSWMEDVTAFVETCQLWGISPAVERSRSGNGAHVWFFFSEPILAATARKMGCYFITQAMTRHHQLSMESYDRLFPNQDNMPRGGFGNLIALPLQHGPRQHKNTVFLDRKMSPIEDQWDYLSKVQRLSPSLVEAIAAEATQKDRVIGVRMILQEEDDAAPWTKSPSGRPRKTEIPGPLPPVVRAVVAQRVFVEKAGLPPALLNQIKRLAAFQNPEFYKKQSMRLSTTGTPRVIACAEELPLYIALPRGCLEELTELLAEHKVGLALDDQRNPGDSIEVSFHGQLSAIQSQAAEEMLAHDLALFVAPPGIGKTVVGTFLLARRARNTLVLVHRKPLLEQWVAQLSLFLGTERKKIGQIGGGKQKPNGRIDVAMIQSLVRKDSVSDIVDKYGHVIIDECHHIPAVSFERVLAAVKARYVTALTATPYRRDGHQPIIHMQCGPVRYAVKAKGQAVHHSFRHRLICRDTQFGASGFDRGKSISDLYAALVADEERNRLILQDVIRSVESGRSPILLTERRDHLDYFASQLRSCVRHLIILHGGMSSKERREALARLTAVPDRAERLILATGRYIGEGFDDARLDTLLLAMPVSWKGTLVQYSGRLHRKHPDKTEVRIFDYVDRNVPVLSRMFDKRLLSYRAIGYIMDDEPLVDDAAYNCDEDGLRSFHYVEDDNEDEELAAACAPATLMSPGIDHVDELPPERAAPD